MSNVKKILTYMEQHEEQFLKVLQHAVELESPTYGAKEITDRCGCYFQKLFRELRMQITVYPQTEVGDHFTAETKGTGKPLLVLCHYDTVFPQGTIQKMPFQQKGNKLYGPGVYDMKGGLVAAYFALRALKKLDIEPQRKIVVCVNSDEEPGSFTSKELFLRLAKESCAVLVLEPGVDTLGSVKTVRKGRGYYTLTAYGKAAHTGHHPDKGINPITELAYQLEKIHEMNDYKNGVSIAPVYCDGGVKGACMIPETASVVFDARYRTVEDAKQLDQKLRALKAVLPGSRLEWSGGLLKYPLTFTEVNQKLFEKADLIARELGFVLEGREVGGGSDGNYVAETDIPVMDGYGMVGANLHTPDEFLYIDCIPKRTALVAELLRTI